MFAIYYLYVYILIFIILIFIILNMYNKMLFFNFFMGWLMLFFLIFWLYSMFVFLFKHYSYSKFVSSVSRFWSSSFNLFWMVESCWFMVFMYCLLTANHEPIHYEEFYMYKNLYMGSFKIFLLNNMIIVTLLLLLLFIIIFIKFISFSQFCMYMWIVNILLLFFFFIELYQFINIISFFWELTWSYNNMLNMYELLVDYWSFSPRVAFYSLMLIGKFWHCIFIIGAWLFFFFKVVEGGGVSNEFLSMNMQNLIIFYMMSWIQLMTILKWYIKFLMKKLWFWFFLNPTNFMYSGFYTNIINFFGAYFFYMKSKLYYLYMFKINKVFFYFISFCKFNKVNFTFVYLVSNLL